MEHPLVESLLLNDSFLYHEEDPARKYINLKKTQIEQQTFYHNLIEEVRFRTYLTVETIVQ